MVGPDGYQVPATFIDSSDGKIKVKLDGGAVSLASAFLCACVLLAPLRSTCCHTGTQAVCLVLGWYPVMVQNLPLSTNNFMILLLIIWA